MCQHALLENLNIYNNLKEITSQKEKEIQELLKKNDWRTKKQKLTKKETKNYKTILTKHQNKQKNFIIDENNPDLSNIQTIQQACEELNTYQKKLTEILTEIHNRIDIKQKTRDQEQIKNYLLDKKTKIIISITEDKNFEEIKDDIVKKICNKMKVHSVTEDDTITVLNDLNIRRPEGFAYGENQIPYWDEKDPKYLTVKLENKEIADEFMRAKEDDPKFQNMKELFAIRTPIQQINNIYKLSLNNNLMYTLINGIHQSNIKEQFQWTIINNITVKEYPNAEFKWRRGTRVMIQDKNNTRRISYFLSGGTIYDTHYKDPTKITKQ